MNGGKTLLECANLRKTYSAPVGGAPEVKVLQGVNFKVQEGEIVTILGASGSGKSTLLNILGGLDQPTSGEVLWEGKSYFGMSEEARSAARGRFVGFVFQFHHLLHEFTAVENVMIPAMIAGTGAKEAGERASSLLDAVGLGGRLHHRPAELSGGEQQRVAVARALVNMPSVVLADEPSGNLDSENSRQLSELIARLNESRRQAFVVVTHNRQFLTGRGRILTMADGILVS